jgi:YVTN family beta-propeller protein
MQIASGSLPRRHVILILLLVATLGLACRASRSASGPSPRPAPGTSPTSAPAYGGVGPPPLDPHDIYAADRAGQLSPIVRDVPYRIYVPNSGGSTVDVIDPSTYKVVATYFTGLDPQHVVPGYDLKKLYATNDLANTLTPIDPMTGMPAGPPIPVEDPYNLYFTPDGAYAIVVAEARQNLDFRDPHTFQLVHRLPVDCAGVDHIDFSADGTYFIATCEFSSKLVKVDVRSQSVMGYLTLSGSPQDIKLDPAGQIFYVADMVRGGVHLIDAARFTEVGFLATGRDAHGLYPSRDGRFLYVSNRKSGTVSVIDFATRRVATTWTIAGGGSPDMGNVSPDGMVLWLSGRNDRVVYAISTVDGRLLAKIPVGPSPHGLCVWPQPGRYSLGHTGILR